MAHLELGQSSAIAQTAVVLLLKSCWACCASPFHAGLILSRIVIGVLLQLEGKKPFVNAPMKSN